MEAAVEQRPRAPLPIAVRRARPEDRDAVLAFASRTWDGWDYIPDAWDHWVSGTDGVLLVATPRSPAAGEDARRDADGLELDPAVPIAVARIAILSADEAWMEGIRVDPRVRGHAVGTNLQVAELAWIAAHGARVVRYVTGEANEGSHRLGQHHGFRLAGAWRTYGRDDDARDEGGDDTPPPPGGGTDDHRPALAAAGLTLPVDADASTVRRWWRRVERDATIVAGGRLYERRSWALQELTFASFQADVAAGVVVIHEATRPSAGEAPPTQEVAGPAPQGWALGVVAGGWLEDDALYLTALCGDAASAVALVQAVAAASGRSTRFRLPDPAPPMLRGDRDVFPEAGLAAREHALHVFERRLDDAPLPGPEPAGALRFDEPPARVARPMRWP